MHRCGLGLRVGVPARCLGLGRSLGLKVLGTGVCIPAQEVSKGDPTNPLSAASLHDMKHAHSLARRPTSQPRMPITLSPPG